MYRLISLVSAVCFLLNIHTSFTFSQIVNEEESNVSASIGADILSRFIWRGLPVGSSTAPHIQPFGFVEINTSAGLINFGVTGSYEFTGDYSEVNLILEYTYSTGIGNFSGTLYDYFYPQFEASFFNYKGKGEGAHILEAGLAYDGADFIPFNFLVTGNIHNDIPDESSLYFETGYTFLIDEISLNLFGGAAKGFSSYYMVTTDKFEIINTGLTAEKEIKLGESLNFGVGISYLINPYLKKNFIIFTLSI